MSLLNLAKMTVSGTPGSSGAITLAAAVTGYISAANAGAVDGRMYMYNITEGNKREVASGLYTASGTTITRNTLRSTNATPTSAETFTSAAIISFIASAEELDSPWYYQPGNASNQPCMGIPGALFPQNMGSNTDWVPQCIYYTPVLLKRRTKFIGANIVVGASIQTNQHAQVGIYAWDFATTKPTTRMAFVDSGVLTANTAFAPDFASPVWLEPGYYAYAFLLTVLAGTNTILSTEYSMEGVWNFSVASNTFKRPMLYSATGFSAMPSPNTGAVTPVSSVANAALGLTTSSRIANLFRFQD